jgi:hypothetical protein
MAFFFGDGFDLYAQTSDAYQGGTYWDSGATSFTLQSGRFVGSRAIQYNATGIWLTKSSAANDSVHHFVVAYEQTVAISGTTLGFYIELFDGTTAQCSVVFRSDGAILLASGAPNGTVLATYTGAVTATSTWYAFEIEVVIHNTAGSITVRKNGNTSNDFTLGSLNTRAGTANNYANKISIGNQGGAAATSLIDDLLWRSDASSVPWVGDVRCYTRRPDADASVQWTRPGTFQMQPFAGITTTFSVVANRVVYSQFVSQGGTIGSINLAINAAGTINIKCAIYRSDGTGGNPGTVIQSATAAISNPAVGTATFTFSPPVSIAKGASFWVAVGVDAAITGYFIVSNAAPFATMAFIGSTTYASFPATNPGSLAASAQQSIFPVVTPTANADAVADLYLDNAVSYLTDSTVNDSDLYTIQAIGSTPSTIIGVVTRGLFEKTDAGTRNVAVQLKSGATTVQSASTPLNTSWGWISRTDTVDPATGAAWTAVAVNNVNIGAQVTA